MKNGKVVSNNLKISQENLFSLEDNLLLFFTGYSREANKILKNKTMKQKKIMMI